MVQPRILANRVEMLEQKMEGLEGLPDRVASLDGRVASLEEQISQFRVETRMEFSAVREEMREMHTELVALISAGDEETRTQMRILHEAVIARLSLMDERWNGGGMRPRRRPRGPAAGRGSKKRR